MILVTGGTGLVGSHVLYQLIAQHKEVRAIYRTSKSFASVKKVFAYYTKNADELFSKIEWIKADITEVPSLENAFSEVTVVYHVAALVSFNPRDYRKMRQVNIEGTANIVNYAISHKLKKICFVSSIAALGDSINDKPIDEENDWSIENSNNGYAISKYGAEMEVWRASQEGLDVVIVNPGVILGPGFWKINTGQLFGKVANGFPYFTEGVTGFVGVEDVARSMVSLTESSIKNQRFILVSENLSFKKLFFEIAKNLGKKTPSLKVSKTVTRILRRLDALKTLFTGKARMLTKDTENALHTETRYSSKKIEKSIGFTFTPIETVIKEVSTFYLKDH